ncbi:NAD-dependent epimerase/dehydratase family protein [Auraticoccus monumenti]|uniref:Nucleoside-diphosphate-sugar epimerase n=1 Tax=Auraticoccus monumenti TaxID=675864 RepID=A0A1G6Y6Z3_9ACTN|nr:NAD(P)-dependent oxidoreductase [Auraticoccus monumenti]SDD86140.1 Nucleoside-diphosphate-sugar epimerase [Auraticoccus monumenti]
MAVASPSPDAGPRTGRRVLVTGADGLIGRATTAHLTQQGWRVSALSRTWDAPVEAERVITGDAADQQLVAGAVADVDAVVHLAAIPHPGLGTPREVFTNNTAATFTVLAEAGEAGVGRAVIASSINAFGLPMNSHDVRPAYFPLDEDSPVQHDDAYSLSKWVDEQTARMAHSRWGTDVLAIRFPLVRDSEALREYAGRAHEDAELARLGREGWAYLDIRDAVTVIEAGLERPLTGAHVVLATAADVLLDTPTAELLRRWAPDVPCRKEFGGREGLVALDRARELLGWSPRHSVHAAADARHDAMEMTA